MASDDAAEPIAPHRVTLRRRLRRLHKRFGLARIPADILRHTAASNLLAREQDIGRVPTWLGNSPGIIAKHYMALVTKESAVEFWAITPDKVKPTIVKLPTQAAA